jgi:hypothetical protein
MSLDSVINIHDLHGKKHIHDLRGTSNLLKLANPDRYHCELFEYQRSLRSLKIKIYDVENSLNFFLLAMTNVFYFSGPVFWDNCEFYLSSAEENLIFMRNFREYEVYPDEIVKDLYLLVKIVKYPLEIKISATNIAIIIQNHKPIFI